MPDVDVGDAILDGDVAGEQFVVVDRREIVDDRGEASYSVSSRPAWGSISPSGENSTRREGTHDSQSKTVEVVTTCMLRGVSTAPGGASYKPSLVVWDDGLYEVSEVNDFSSFGVGFVQATAVALDYNPLPPNLTPPAVGALDLRYVDDGVNAGAL